MAGIAERLRAPIDSVVTVVGMYHSEKGAFPDHPKDPSLASRAVIHYRPWGVILHAQNANGKLLGRVEARSGIDLIEALDLEMPKTPLELRT